MGGWSRSMRTPAPSHGRRKWCPLTVAFASRTAPVIAKGGVVVLGGWTGVRGTSKRSAPSWRTTRTRASSCGARPRFPIRAPRAPTPGATCPICIGLGRKCGFPAATTPSFISSTGPPHNPSRGRASAAVRTARRSTPNSTLALDSGNGRYCVVPADIAGRNARPGRSIRERAG